MTTPHHRPGWEVIVRASPRADLWGHYRHNATGWEIRASGYSPTPYRLYPPGAGSPMPAPRFAYLKGAQDYVETLIRAAMPAMPEPLL